MNATVMILRRFIPKDEIASYQACALVENYFWFVLELEVACTEALLLTYEARRNVGRGTLPPVIYQEATPDNGIQPSYETRTIEAVAYDLWPWWAKTIYAMWGVAGLDAGVGDTVKRKLGSGGEAFKATLLAIGVPCGCDRRRALWNVLYPYPTE